MYLESIPKRKNRIFKKKRIGRGAGSGKGAHTVGRGTKGQKSRSGHKSMEMFEGGNVPFYRRMPKFRGFTRQQKIEYQPINIEILEKEYSAGETVSIISLRDKGLIKKRTTHVKLLGDGVLTKKLLVEGVALSATARKKIVELKGEIKE